MRKLTYKESKKISGGCIGCPIVPASCVVVAAAGATATYFGWSKQVRYVGMAAMVVAFGYIFLSPFFSDD